MTGTTHETLARSIDELRMGLQPHVGAGERVRAASAGPTGDRLLEVQRRHDPANVFRRNQPVAPAR